MAFMMLHSLPVVVFACLCRIAALTRGEQFTLYGHPRDHAPCGLLACMLASAEMVAGLLLLFGSREIMRAGTARGTPERRHDGDPCRR